MSSKNKLKEKILSWYDAIFGLDALVDEYDNFWDEFFLLRPKNEYLSDKVKALNEPKALQLLVEKCLHYGVSGSSIQCANCLQTLSIAVLALSKKFKPEHCFEFLDFLFGFDSATEKIDKLSNLILGSLNNRKQPLVKNLALSLFLSSVCARDTLESNPLSVRLLSSSISNSLSSVFETVSQDDLGERLLVSFVLLLSIRSAPNPAVQCMSCLDSALALDGIGAIIHEDLRSHIQTCLRAIDEVTQEESAKPGGWLSYMSSMFVQEQPKYSVSTADASLLTLLITLKMNRNFVPVLTQWRARENNSEEDRPDAGSPPLATFLEYTSLLQQNIRDKKKYNATMVAFNILTLIAQDQYANSFLHDSSVKFRLRLHRAPLRHRPVRLSDSNAIAASTFAAWIVEICAEFVISHLMKCFPLKIHALAIGVMHRLLIYQKRAKTRLNFNWRVIWETLIHLLRFVVSNISSLSRQHSIQEIHQLISQVLIVLNIFITFGDIVLLSTTSYDELYYELIRLKETFALLEKYIEKAIRDDVDAEGSRRCMALLFNIRAIQKHFEPILEDSHSQGLSEKEVLALIQSNYDSLNLRMLDGLDHFGSVSSSSLNSITVEVVRNVIVNTRETLLILDPLDYKQLLQS